MTRHLARVLVVALAACGGDAGPSTAFGSPTTYGAMTIVRQTTAAEPSPIGDDETGGSDSAEGTHSKHSHAFTFHSDALGVDKRAIVYLPASYESSPQRSYPVFYYLHGITGAETDWTLAGHLDLTADALGLEAIVVMPDGDDDFYIDSAEPIDYDACLKTGAGLLLPNAFHPEHREVDCVRHRNYETYITRDLIGFVDAHFRTLASREGRAVAGLSMGGYGALMLAGRHPDLFAAVASHSGIASLFYAGPIPYDAAHVQLITEVSKWPNATGTPDPTAGGIGAWVRGLFGADKAFWEAHDPVTLLTKLGPGKLAIYIDCGTEDDLHLDAPATYLHDRLVAAHVEHAFHLVPGHHSFTFWAPRATESLTFLRDHTAPAK